jgi:hypothetical protein
MAPIRPPGQRQQSASPIKPTAPFELKMAPIKPKTVLIRAPGKRQRFLSPIKPRAPNEPRAPIKPKTAPIRPRSKGVLTDYSFGHLTRIQSQIQGSSVCFTFPSDHAPRVQQSRTLPASPRVSALSTPQFFSKSKNMASSSSLLSSISSVQSSSMLPSSLTLLIINQPMSMLRPTQVPARVSLFLFANLTLPPQTSMLWPTQVPSWVSLFFFCFIGLTSMLLLQGCVHLLVSGDGQTASYQPHIHANTIKSSREQHHCSLNL